jgi:outer membrane protein, heavy metal efflux system
MRATGLLSASFLLACCTTYRAQPLEPDAKAQAFMARTLTSSEVRAFFAARHQELPAAGWHFADLWLAALCCEPGLRAARTRLAIAVAEQQRAGERPNPTLGFVPEWSANPGPGVPAWVLGLTLDLPLEPGGKRSARVQLAAAEKRQTAFATAAAIWRQREQLATVCVQRLFAVQRLAAAQRIVTLHDSIVGLLEQRLTAGAVASGEVAAARIELQRAGAERDKAQNDVEQLRHDLAVAVGVPAQALEQIELAPDEPPEPPSRTLAELHNTALHARVDLLQEIAAYAVKEAALQVEISKQYPNLQLGPGYQYDQGQNKYVLGFSFELPLFNHNSGAIAVATADRAAAAATFETLQDRVIGDVDKAFADRAPAQARLQALANLQGALQEQARRSAQRLAQGEDDAASARRAELAAAVGAQELLAAREQAALARVQLEAAVGVPLGTLTAEPDVERAEQGVDR